MSSYFKGKDYVSLYLKSHFNRGSKCLDVGCCEGWYYDLLSDWFIMDGVEVWYPNIVKHQLYDKYHNLFYNNIVGLEYGQYDVIIFGDVLEHMEVYEAQQVLEYAKAHASEVIVAVPYNYPQDDLDGNQYEIHKQPDLTPEIFNQRYPGFTRIYALGDIYGYYKLKNTPFNTQKMLAFASNNVIKYSLPHHDSSTDKLYLLRSCLDYYTMSPKNSSDEQKNLAGYLLPHMEKLKQSVLNKQIPHFFNFWNVIYNLYTWLDAEQYKEQRREALNSKFNQDEIQWNKWTRFAIDENSITINWIVEYTMAATALYYMGYKSEAKFYNDQALRLNPNDPVALNNVPYFQ